jgi:hypothetical protein
VSGHKQKIINKGKQKCQNLKSKLVVAKTVLVCTTTKATKKNTKLQNVANKITAQMGGFTNVNFILARIG